MALINFATNPPFGQPFVHRLTVILDFRSLMPLIYIWNSWMSTRFLIDKMLCLLTTNTFKIHLKYD